MNNKGVLMTCPISTYLEQQLETNFKLFKLWQFEDTTHFFNTHGESIQAFVGNARAGLDAELIESLPKLEIIANHGVGVDHIDFVKCKEKGIRVTNTPDVLSDDVADLAIGLALAVLRTVCQNDRYVRYGNWKKGDHKMTTKFTGKAVGILGMGKIGTAIAKRAEAFSCTINYHSRTQKPNLKNYNYFPSVIELASSSQILIVACSLNEETKGIVNREVMDALGPKGVLVNIGRGKIVDETELVAALVEGRLGGAGLDVFENEPQVPEKLFGLDNVVMVPHVGSNTVETRKAMADIVVGNLKAHFMNQPLLSSIL